MKRLIAASALLLFACGRGKDGDPGMPGPPGPPGDDASAAPRIDAVSPPVGSVRNTVLVTGTNFSANAAEIEVRFAGVLATILEATPTALRVVPPGEVDPGPAPITVTRGAKSSASVGFLLAPSGTTLAAEVAVVKRPGEPIELADGRILVPDRDEGAILEIATTGVVRTLARANGLADPVRLLLRGDGTVLVFDAEAPAIFRLDPAAGSLEIERFGTAYVAGAYDAAGNLYVLPAAATTGFDRIAPDGTVVEGWASYPAGAVGVDVQVIGTNVFVAFDGASAGVQRYDAGTGGLGTPHSVAGMNEIRSIAANGTALTASGDFTATSGEGVVSIDGTTGAISAVTTSAAPFTRIAGAYREQDGDHVIADEEGRWIGRLAAAGTLSALSGVGSGVDHLMAAGASTWAVIENGGGKPGWILAIDADGTSKVVARGRFGQLAPSANAGKLLVTRVDLADVAEIDVATFALTSVLDVSAQLTEPLGYAEDAGGNRYVSSAIDGAVVRYDAAGTPDAAFAPAVPGASHLRVDGAYLYVTSPGTGSLKRVFLANGAVSAVFDATAGVVEPGITFRDQGPQGDSFLYVTDATGGWIYRIDGDGHGSVAPHVPLAAGALLQREDGMLVAAGTFGLRFIAP